MLTDLPFKFLSTWNFRIEKGNVENITITLSQIKTLETLEIQPAHEGRYQMKLKEFALFKHLPVKSVALSALDLSTDNIDEFDQIMNEMKIEHLDHDCDFDIEITSFGTNEIYQSIKMSK